MTTDSTQPESVDTESVNPEADSAPQATDDAASLDEVPAVAGGNDDSEPAQGAGEAGSF